MFHNVKSNTVSLNEAIDVAQNHPLWRLLVVHAGNESMFTEQMAEIDMRCYSPASFFPPKMIIIDCRPNNRRGWCANRPRKCQRV